MRTLTRRHFVVQSSKIAAGFSLWPLLSSCGRTPVSSASRKKFVILGIDGMDPFLLARFIKEGAMPNFLRLVNIGGLREMRSSIPPQSPVAWSDFAVGATAKVHGIFDFIHRDPKTMIPYFSTSQVYSTTRNLSIGDWEIPLGSGSVKQLREGKPFWEYLEEAGIPSTIFKLPANFPAQSKTTKIMSGMGTPDLLGSYGTFSLFTSSPPDKLKEITGGMIIPVKIINNKITAELKGPINTLKKDKSNIRIPFVVWRDPQNKVIKLILQDHELIMTTGEWSDWLQLSFDFLPYIKSVKGICKIYIKQIHPEFEMYVSPMNIDPSDQALPITSSGEYGRELVDQIGFFHTKGLPADTKALSYDVLPEEEYLELSRQILDESKAAMRYELGKLNSQKCGVLFFYFSNLDQDSHMFWRAIDRNHPLYTQDLGKTYSGVIKNLYKDMDNILGDVFKSIESRNDNFRLIVMSDHGFAPFYRCVNLNTWLLNNGLVSLIDRHSQGEHTFFENVNWSKTKAYGLGINALYLNLAGREQYGTIGKHEAKKLLA
ncbi:MAG: alkaline phosphatase family protein, partial [Candidatus Hodarchaeota archaeon]